jgi:hypothetical protein
MQWLLVRGNGAYVRRYGAASLGRPGHLGFREADGCAILSGYPELASVDIDQRLAGHFKPGRRLQAGVSRLRMLRRNTVVRSNRNYET